MALQFDQLNNQLKTNDSTNANASLTLTPAGTGAVLLNGTGQNLLTYSQTFTNAIWNRTSGTAVDNVTTAPDGTTTAASFISNNAATGYLINPTNSVSGLTYTCSVYLKPNGRTSWTLLAQSNMFADASSRSATFTLSGSGTVASTSGTGITAIITSVGNSWYRCSIAFTTTLATTGSGVQIRDAATGDGTTGIYLWGAQVEIGSVTNAYTPTTTAAIYNAPQLSFSGVAGLGLQSDGSLYVQPAGTGALQAQATTSSTVGGNARGANAVDWQTSRSAATMVASGTYNAISGGRNNTASSFDSAIGGGSDNFINIDRSFIGGGNLNTVNGSFSSVVGGKSNTSGGYFNFIGGGFTNSGTASAAVTTQAAATNGVTSGSTAVTLAASNASIKVGQYITGTGIAQDTYVSAITTTSLTLSKNATATGTPTLSFYTPHGVVVGGGNNQATGQYSFIGGGGDAGTAANRNVASGDWSSIAGGFKNIASGLYSGVFGGQNNTASGQSSAVLGGSYGTASTFGASVVGGNAGTANATYSSVIGGNYGTTRSIAGNTVLPSSNSPISSAAGVSQAALLILGRQTTDATATVLTSDTSAASTTNQVILPNNSAYSFRVTVIAGVTGGGNTSSWTLQGAIKRGANAAATAIVGSVTTTLLAQDAGASTWAISATADTTNGGLAITFTGQAGTTIRVVAKVETTEMTY